MSLLADSFKYYAKFPQKDGVLRNFNRADSTIVTGYSALKAEITALTIHSLIPDIVDFVVGIDQTTIQKRIKNISGIYMFLDYGAIAISKDDIQREYTEFLLALNIARPVDPEKTDYVEEILLGDIMLSYMLQVRDIMKADQLEDPFVKQLDFPHEITPFFAADLSNSAGWTMIFKKKGLGLL